MGVQKRADGRYEVYCYDPAIKRKRYVGSRKKKGEAAVLFADKTREFRGSPPVDEMTVREYSERWLEFKHGPETRRPKAGTLRHNRQMLTAFLETYGDRAMTAIPRNEALDWSLKHRSAAKTVAAMFNDAINDDLIKANPFANRQHKQMRGRKDITPMTEAEVELLAEIARDIWHGYGKVCKAWVLWSAWVGTRPGETFGLTWDQVDVDRGLVTVERIKPPYNTDTIPVNRRALDALLATPFRAGLLFPSATGKSLATNNGYPYYWDPIRKAFETHIPKERRDLLREGEKEIPLYALRHFCASQIVARGGNEYDCAAMLGNTPEVCRETYIHEFKTERRERLRGLLDSGTVSELDAARQRRGA
jgi:integrase